MARGITGAKRQKKVSHNPRKIHVRRGDKVKVISGNFKGETGTVIRVLPKENRVVIEGINRRTKHMRPTQENPDGGRITFEAPIHASNVMLIDESGEPTRVRQRIDEDGTKERISARSGKPIARPRV